LAKHYVYDDGGRAAAGFKGEAGDCVARSIAIASGLPYAEVYRALAEGNAEQRVTRHVTKGRARKRTARNGINTKRKWFKDYMASLGAVWTPTMKVGQGCKVHLRADELPPGRLVVAVSRHYTAVIDGVIHDTFDPTDRGTTIYSPGYPKDEIPKGARWLENGNGWAYSPERCVYGYWTFLPCVSSPQGASHD
jgi:hypothetical protein